MTLTILVALGLPLGAVILASFAGALLAPPDLLGRCTVFRSQWSTRQTRIAAPPSQSGVTQRSAS